MEKTENTLGTQIQHDSGLSVQVTMAIRDFLQPSMGLNTGLWAPLFQFMAGKLASAQRRRPRPASKAQTEIKTPAKGSYFRDTPMYTESSPP